MGHLTVLAAGDGGVRFVTGLVDVRSEEEVRVLVNVGDDGQICGLRCSPDIDRILHALAGELDPYGPGNTAGATFACWETLRKLGLASWLPISDRGLATHLIRTSILNSGVALDRATEELAERFGVGVSLIPITNDTLQTTVHTVSDGSMSSLEYRARMNELSPIDTVSYEGASTARPSPRAVASILEAERVILAPGHPELGIGALLAIPDIRNALARSRASVVAISPVVGSQPARGNGSGPPTPDTESRSPVLRFAEALQGAVDSIVIHTTDFPLLEAVRSLGVDAWIDNILMNSREDAARLAGRVAFGGRLVARKR